MRSESLWRGPRSGEDGRQAVLPRGFYSFLRRYYKPRFFGSTSGPRSRHRGFGGEMFRKRSEEGRRGKEGARGGASTRCGQGRSIAIPETVKSILSFCRLALGRPFPAGRGTTPGPNEFCRETQPTALAGCLALALPERGCMRTAMRGRSPDTRTRTRARIRARIRIGGTAPSAQALARPLLVTREGGGARSAPGRDGGPMSDALRNSRGGSRRYSPSQSDRLRSSVSDDLEVTRPRGPPE